jgi:hypothetical protein
MLRALLSVASCCAIAAACGDVSPPLAPSPAAIQTASASQAGAPQPIEILAVVENACEFPVQLAITGKEKVMFRGDGSIFVTSPGSTVTLTNLDTDEEMQQVITGSINVVFHDNGDADLEFRGRNLVELESGLFISVGIWTATFDVEGNEVNPFRGTGQLLDVCAALS